MPNYTFFIAQNFTSVIFNDRISRLKRNLHNGSGQLNFKQICGMGFDWYMLVAVRNLQVMMLMPLDIFLTDGTKVHLK